MKYIIVFCISYAVTKPAIYQKDLVVGSTPTPPVMITQCDSVKVNSETELKDLINSFTPQVTIKRISQVKK